MIMSSFEASEGFVNLDNRTGDVVKAGNNVLRQSPACPICQSGLRQVSHLVDPASHAGGTHIRREGPAAMPPRHRRSTVCTLIPGFCLMRCRCHTCGSQNCFGNYATRDAPPWTGFKSYKADDGPCMVRLGGFCFKVLNIRKAK